MPAAPIRARAARCLASLDDVSSVETLLARLHDPDQEVRDYTLAALRRLSGRGFAADPSRWEDWYQDELAWWRVEGLAALQKLKSSHQGQVIAAALELCQHRLFAPEILPELVPRIKNARPEVQTAIFQALTQVGHRGARRLH